MSIVGVIDAVAWAAAATAVVLLLRGWRRALSGDARLLLLGLLSVNLFCHFSDALEWLGLNAGLDPASDALIVLQPLLWGFFFYAFIQDQTQRDLRESEERNRILLASLPHPIFFKDAKSVVVSVNERFARDYGMPPADFVGKTDWDLYPGDLAEKYRADDERVLASGGPETLVERNVVQGTERIVEVTKAPVMDDAGEAVGLLGVFTDITERVGAEEELRDREAFLASVFASIQDGVVVLDADLNVVRVNPTAEQRHAHRGPLVGRKCYEAFYDRTAPCENCPSLRSLQTRRAAHEVIARTGPGGSVAGWLDLHSSPLIDRATGTLTGVIEVVRDITDRKRADEALRASEEKYRLILENATDIVTLHSVENLTYLYVNPATVGTLGYAERDLLGTSALDYMHPEDRDLMSRFREAVSRGDGRAEVRFRKKDGSYVWLESTGKLTVDEIGKQVMLVLSRDITDRVQRREELRALSLQDVLTKVGNRRGFDHLADQQLKVAQRTGDPVLLLFADVDNMKWINDSLGHREGDLALIETANVLRESFRDSDIIGRVGGDEFAVLAIEADVGQAPEILDRLQDRLAARNAQSGRHFRLSVSVGIVAYDPAEPLPLDELMARADALMYEDKRARRNPGPA